MMVWFVVDDGFYSHPKVIEIPRTERAAAIGVWTICGTWCADKLTDGRIAHSMAMELGCSEGGIESLLRVKLWKRIKGGRYEFVNWDEWQMTRAQVEEKRAKERERKARGKASPPPDANDSAGGSARKASGIRPSLSLSHSLSQKDEVTNLPEVPNEPLSTGGDDPVDNSLFRKIIAACATRGVDIHPLVVPDILAFIDARRGPRAKPIQAPERYYPGVVRDEWPVVSQFIHEKGLAS